MRITDASVLRSMIKLIQADENKRGTFFSAINTKKDGTLRRWTCRLDVRKHLHGGSQPYKPEERNLITVWDPNADGPDKYRNLNVDTLERLVVCKKVVIINGSPTNMYHRYFRSAMSQQKLLKAE